jgi:hypothetical protein
MVRIENQHFLIRRLLNARYRVSGRLRFQSRDVGARARRYCRVNYDTHGEMTRRGDSPSRRPPRGGRKRVATEPGRAIAASSLGRYGFPRAPEEKARYRARARLPPAFNAKPPLTQFAQRPTPFAGRIIRPPAFTRRRSREVNRTEILISQHPSFPSISGAGLVRLSTRGLVANEFQKARELVQRVASSRIPLLETRSPPVEDARSIS